MAHIAEAIVRFEPGIDYDRFHAYMQVMRVHATERNYAEAREPSLRFEREAAERAKSEAALQKQREYRQAAARARKRAPLLPSGRPGRLKLGPPNQKTSST